MYNLVSVHPKSIKLGQTIILKVIFYVVVSEPRPSFQLNLGMAYPYNICCMVLSIKEKKML